MELCKCAPTSLNAQLKQRIINYSQSIILCIKYMLVIKKRYSFLLSYVKMRGNVYVLTFSFFVISRPGKNVDVTILIVRPSGTRCFVFTFPPGPVCVTLKSSIESLTDVIFLVISASSTYVRYFWTSELCHPCSFKCTA